MCLDRVDWVKENRRVGYKIFKIDERGHLRFYNIDDKPKGLYIRVGRWINDLSDSTQTILDTYLNTRYPIGFHIWDTLEAVTRWRHLYPTSMKTKIFRVEFEDIVAKGYQEGQICYVARRMKLVEEVV